MKVQSMFFRFDDKYWRYRLWQSWQNLPLRKWIIRNPKIIIAITLGSLLTLAVVTAASLFSDSKPEYKPPKKEWYYDLNTGKLFTAQPGLNCPVDAPSGPLPDGSPAGVRAYVLSYSDDPKTSDYFIAFLETTDPYMSSDSQNPADPNLGGAQRWAAGKLIRRLNDDRWFPAAGHQGIDIVKKAFAPDSTGRTPSYLLPH
ncbi:MAG: hypothetical protein ABIG61_11505 [Planctomycetota bacterium]